MIKGMTGFAEEQFSYGAIRGSVEVRGLNSRYFDLALHVPSGFNCFEERIKKILSDKVKRGRVSVVINFLNKSAPKIIFNNSLAREYLLALRKLKQSLNLKDDASLSLLARMPGIFVLEEERLPASIIWIRMETSFKKALVSFLKGKNKEGRCLYQDISARIKQIRGFLSKTQTAIKALIKEKNCCLSAEDFSGFLKSSDVSEELIRLKFHLNSVQKLLKSNDSVGKELDFICQELLREINTTSAKLAEKQIANYAIKIKSEIEKIREQAQNVE